MAKLKAQFTAYTSSRSALTANGTHPNEYTCAAPKEIPFGTKIKVQGTGTKYDGRTYKVTDRGSAIKIVDGRYIFDLWMSSEGECVNFGRRNGSVTTGSSSGNVKSNTTTTNTSNALDIVDVAISQIGTSESNNGHAKYINWYGGFGTGTPWCAIFVSWCANQAGVSTSIIPKFSSCAVGRSWFESKGLFKYKGSYTPKRGDIIFFLSNGASHTGIVEKCTGGTVYTIEGNTSNKVARRNYSVTNSRITGYGIPKYTNLNSISISSSNSNSNNSEEEAKQKAYLELQALQEMLSVKSNPIEDLTEYDVKDQKLDTVFNFKVVINNFKKEFTVPVEDGAELKLESSGQPGTFTFTTIPDKDFSFAEGNSVLVVLNKKKIFFGFIFSKKRSKDGKINVTAYDQLRYLKNEDILIYSNKSTNELIKMIANDYKLRCGMLEDTGYKYSAVEDGSTLYEMIENSINQTTLKTGKTFVFYDRVGKLTLQNVAKMKVNWVISEDTAEDFDYESSIDKDVYNQIKVIYKDDTTGVAKIYVAKSTASQNKWGVLQTTDEIPWNLKALGKLKSKVLLNYYNKKRRTLSVIGVFGNAQVIAGCLVPVILNLGDIKVQNWMMVTKVTHKFTNNSHKMDLELIGGEFVE